MDFIDNDPKQIAIRKYQNTLIVVGTGIILFGAWTVVKVLGSFFMLREETVAAMRKLSGEAIDELPDSVVFYITLAVVLLIMLISLAVRSYVGLSAISEGRGRKRRRLYLPLAVIMIISGIMSFVTSFFVVNGENALGALSQDTTLSGLIIELTSIVMLTEMVVSAVRIRKLKHADKKGGGR